MKGSGFFLCPLFFLPSLLLLAGCPDRGGVEGDGTLPEGEREYTYSMKLSDREPEAGETVTITHTVTDQKGDDWTDEAVISVESDPDEGVMIGEGGRSIVFEKAITHRVIGVAVIDGHILEEEESADVGPSDPDSIDISLSPSEVEAGQEATVTSTVYDPFGNTVQEGFEVEIIIDPAEGTAVYGDIITAGKAGYYTVTGRVKDSSISDSETLIVVAGPPFSLLLTLSTTEIEKGDTVEAEVKVYDPFGNLCDDPYNLYTDPSSGVTVSGDDITFSNEGWFTVVAEVASDPSIYDMEGPILIDSSGPVIDIIDPERGSYQSSSPITVTGQVYDLYSGVDSFILNSVEIPLDSSGFFSFTIYPSIGINILEGEAMDTDGNIRTIAQSFLYGESFIPTGGQVLDAFIARINQTTIEIIEDEVIASIDLSSIEAQIMAENPVMEVEEEWCTWLGCITLYSAYVNVTGVSFSNPAIEIDPGSGYIRIEFTVDNLDVDFSASGEIMEIGYSTSGDVTADRGVVTADAWLSADSAGNVDVALTDVDVSLEGFFLDVNNFPDELEELLADYLREEAESALVDAVYDEVPQAMSDALEDLDISTSLEILDRELLLEALITGIEVDDYGMTLDLDTIITTTVDTSMPESPGSLYTSSYSPSYSSTPGFALSISDDFLNSAMHSVWISGALNYSLTEEDLGIDPDELEGLPFELSEFDLILEPLLPPVALFAGDGTASMEIQVGDMILEMYSDISGTYSLMMELSISMFASADLSISSTNEIEITVNDAAFYFDLLASDSETMMDTEFELLLQDLVPYLLPLLTSYLESFPLPDFEGYYISGASVYVDGPSLDYLTVAGDLAMF